MLLGEVIQAFLTANPQFTEATREGYVMRLELFRKRILGDGEDRDIRTITPAELATWYASLYQQGERFADHAGRPTETGGLSPHTIDNYYRGVRAFFNWADGAGLLDKNPMVGIKHSKPARTPPKWLEEHEVKALLHAAKESGIHRYALLRWMLSTGVRAGEAQRLELSHLNLPRLRATIHQSKHGKSRPIFFDEGTAAAVERYLVHRRSLTPFLWVTEYGEQFGRTGIAQVLRRVCKVAKIEPVGPHVLRHTFAIASLRMGIDPDMVRRQMGHSDIRTTYEYVNWATEDLAEAFSVSRFDDESLRKPRLALVK